MPITIVSLGRMPARPRPATRRDFLKAAGAAIGLLGLGALPGCAEEDLGAGSGFTVWVAQSVSGRVFHSVTQKGIEGASVTMWAGFDKNALFQVAPAVATDVDGKYSLVRGGGDYWWFQVGDDKPRTVYVRLDVLHARFEPAHPLETLPRIPSKSPNAFENYALLVNVPMVQINEP